MGMDREFKKGDILEGCQYKYVCDEDKGYVSVVDKYGKTSRFLGSRLISKKARVQAKDVANDLGTSVQHGSRKTRPVTKWTKKDTPVIIRGLTGQREQMLNGQTGVLNIYTGRDTRQHNRWDSG